MSLRITFPTFLLQQHLRELARSRRPWVDCPVGLSWLRFGAGVEVIASRQPSPGRYFLRLWLGQTLQWPDAGGLACECVAMLCIGSGETLGRAGGWVRPPEQQWQAATELALSGPGMHLIPLESDAGPDRNPERRPRDEHRETRWSRTMGALGADNYRRLTELRIGLIGCGRSGSLAAWNLAARLGVRRLVLVDPDAVELHNAGEGEFSPTEVGELKVEALRRRILREQPDAEIVAIHETAAHYQAIEALKRCDVLFSAPDQPAARLAAGALAAAYARPLLDLGTRVHREGETAMGADIRLIGPERCLLCFGGVNQEQLGQRLLESPDAEAEYRERRDWRAERPGSLRSLNELGLAAAQRTLEDYVSGQVTESEWCRLEFHRNGRIAVAYPAPPPAARPCACGILGWGDAGLSRFSGILKQRGTTTGTTDRL